jgi:hypothetical protein
MYGSVGFSDGEALGGVSRGRKFSLGVSPGLSHMGICLHWPVVQSHDQVHAARTRFG